MSIGLKNVYKKSYFERGIELLIRSNFKEWPRFRVDSERRKYRPSEDPSIYGQKTGALPEVCEIYFNNKYLCDVRENMKPDEALAVIEFSLIQKLK